MSASDPSAAREHDWETVRAWWGGNVKRCRRCGFLWVAEPTNTACIGAKP